MCWRLGIENSPSGPGTQQFGMLDFGWPKISRSKRSALSALAVRGAREDRRVGPQSGSRDEKVGRGVRRQGFRDNGLGKLREALAHRHGDVRRPAAGAASGD